MVSIEMPARGIVIERPVTLNHFRFNEPASVNRWKSIGDRW